MFSYLMLFVLFLPNICQGYLIGTNIKFDINHFNDSRCLYSQNVSELIFYCDDHISTCCNSTINIIAPIQNPRLDVCYDLDYNDSNTYVSYNCEEAEISEVTNVEILAIIALILLGLLIMSIIISMLKCLCCPKRRDENYDRL